jgi:hypothetical protein
MRSILGTEIEAEDGAVDGEQDFKQVDEVTAIVSVAEKQIADAEAQEQRGDDAVMA